MAGFVRIEHINVFGSNTRKPGDVSETCLYKRTRSLVLGPTIRTYGKNVMLLEIAYIKNVPELSRLLRAHR